MKRLFTLLLALHFGCALQGMNDWKSSINTARDAFERDEINDTQLAEHFKSIDTKTWTQQDFFSTIYKASIRLDPEYSGRYIALLLEAWHPHIDINFTSYNQYMWETISIWFLVIYQATFGNHNVYEAAHRLFDNIEINRVCRVNETALTELLRHNVITIESESRKTSNVGPLLHNCKAIFGAIIRDFRKKISREQTENLFKIGAPQQDDCASTQDFKEYLNLCLDRYLRPKVDLCKPRIEKLNNIYFAFTHQKQEYHS